MRETIAMGWTFACPHCDGHFRAAPASLGRVVRCPVCEQKFSLERENQVESAVRADAPATAAERPAALPVTGQPDRLAALLPPQFPGDLPPASTAPTSGAPKSPTQMPRLVCRDERRPRGDDDDVSPVLFQPEQGLPPRWARDGHPQRGPTWGRRARNLALFLAGAVVLAVAAAALMRR